MGLLDDRQRGLLAMQHNVDPRYKAAARAPAANAVRGLLNAFTPQNVAQLGLEMLPGAGDFAAARDSAQAGQEMVNNFKAGDYGGAASSGLLSLLAGVGVFPAVPALGGMVARVSPEADRWLAGNARRNPKKLVNEGIRSGIIPESKRDDAIDLALGARHKQAERRQFGWAQDPLDVAARTRPGRAEKLRREKGILSAPIAAHWNKEFREKAVNWGRISPQHGDDEARKATLEAIAREARKRGLKVRHTSAGRDGRASSRYVVFPNGKEVRLSDHELPETAARFERAGNGRAPRWSGEIVIDDWRTRDMDSYFSEMAEIVSD